MKHIIIIVLVVLFYIPVTAKDVKVILPTGKHSTSFAIITDNETYLRIKKDILAYRDALQADGLATWIVCGDWKNPMDVKNELKKLYKKNKNLEGVVFMGDIPVVLVRNAQHMTTAFKMDEKKYPIKESSVASDRFYDDLALEFNFICQDSLNPLHFYYNLSEYGPQHLNPTFYSGRIMYPSELGGDKYEEIGKFLRKVVRERQMVDEIDHMLIYAGGGYNSDDLTVWLDDGVLIRESFPLVGYNANSLRRLNFRMKESMKSGLLEQLQRREIDLMIFNEHGSVGKQHISGSDGPKTDEERVKTFRSALLFKSGYNWEKDPVKKQDILNKLSKEYGLSPIFFEPQQEKSTSTSTETDVSFTGRSFSMDDSLIPGEDADIILDDLKDFITMPRFVIFNACYNGSFHKSGNIASYYLFNDGNTVVTQGNTVNVLQDRWTFEMVGVLSHGVRIGQYNQIVATLEGHILGDPAFRFKSIEFNTLSEDVLIRRDTKRDAAYWYGLLDSPYADVRSLAVRQLVRMGTMGSDELLEIMQNCPFATTRGECLKLICNLRDSNMIEAIIYGMYDSYEGVRRQAGAWAWRNGSPELAEATCDLFINYQESQRVVYNHQKTLELLPEQVVRAALQKSVINSDYLDKESLMKEAFDILDSRIESRDRTMATLSNPKATLQARISAIRSVRNNIYHESIPEFLKLLGNPELDTELRVNIAEALGWFTHSYRRTEILSGLESIIKEKNMPQEVKNEINQTIGRLK